MVYSQATGGLGNQLFNYAIGFALAQKNNDTLSIDISPYAFSPRPFVLKQLNISGEVISLCPPKKNARFFRMIARFFRILASNRYGLCKWVKESPETRNQYGSYDFSYKHNIYLEGYWQNYQYFNDYYELLCKEFQPAPDVISAECQMLIDNCTSCQSVAVHVRRGDYESSWILNEDYYCQGLSVMNERLEAPHFFIFCEDTSYAEEHFSHLHNATFITGKYSLSDLEEFYLISSCRHQIIANSTYSWWAAYLNTYPDKLVIAPVYMHWTPEYYPNSWILIE